MKCDRTVFDVTGYFNRARDKKKEIGKGKFSSFFFSIKMRCDPSLKLHRRDGTNAGTQHMFCLRSKTKEP